MSIFGTLLFLGLSVSYVLTAPDPILRKSEGHRYVYMRGEDGTPHLVDSWLRMSDLTQIARYNPEQEDQYHLFTRANPTTSQPLVMGFPSVVQASNFDASKKTVVLSHGWTSSVTGTSNLVLIPALLAGADVNVIAVDWSVGAASIFGAIRNSYLSGINTASFVSWLLSATGQTVDDLILIGFSLGCQHAAITARYLGGQVPYLLVLDPPDLPWENNLQLSDALYIESINTDVTNMGPTPSGHVDFYPNRGYDMPGCAGGTLFCNHDRAFYYAAEAFVSGGFTARKCESYEEALAGACTLDDTLQMGGWEPKTGSTGVYFLETNSFTPFSRG